MLEIEGVRFRTESEYAEALRDKAKIDELKRLYDINTKAGVLGIYKELQQISLHSELGRKFDDDVYDLRDKYLSGLLTDETDNSEKKAERKTSGKRAKKRTESSSRPEKDYGREPLDPKLQKAVEKELKKMNRRHFGFVFLLAGISVACLAYFGNYMLKAEQVEREANALSELKSSSAASFISVEPILKKEYSEEVVIPEILDEYKILYNKNKSLIGWIKIADTKIDYPVMQTTNNEYYLKHNFDQKEDANGCIFLDMNNDVILGNDNYIIYGHHMKSGKMFGSLVKYANEDYYKTHKYIQFDTIYEKGTYEVMYVFRSRIFSSDEITFKYYQFIDANSETEFNSAMEAMAEMSLYDTGVTARYGDQLLTLSTCDYQEMNGRFAVVAKKIY